MIRDDMVCLQRPPCTVNFETKFNHDFAMCHRRKRLSEKGTCLLQLPAINRTTNNLCYSEIFKYNQKTSGEYITKRLQVFNFIHDSLSTANFFGMEERTNSSY